MANGCVAKTVNYISGEVQVRLWCGSLCGGPQSQGRGAGNDSCVSVSTQAPEDEEEEKDFYSSERRRREERSLKCPADAEKPWADTQIWYWSVCDKCLTMGGSDKNCTGLIKPSEAVGRTFTWRELSFFHENYQLANARWSQPPVCFVLNPDK